jgi:hypothetical protein
LPFQKTEAGIPIGHWRSHQAYSDATMSLKAFGQIFVLSDGSLYSYNPDDDAVFTYDKTSGLSDYQITTMAYCKAENSIILVYSNGNIDILYENGKLFNFTDLKNSTVIDKSVYQIKISGNIAYLSSGAGLIFFDLHRLEIKNTYRFNSPVKTFTLDGDSIFCATEKDGIMLGNINDNLLDRNNWKQFHSQRFIDLFTFDGELICRSYDKRVWKINRTNSTLHNIMDRVENICLTFCSYFPFNYPGTVMIMENGKWKSFQDNINEITGLSYINLTEAAQDPQDRNHIFVGSARQGLYEFKNGSFHKLHTWDNSGLKNILEVRKYDYVSVSSLQYDNDGNLWMTNNEVDTIIKVLEPDGNWFGLYYKDIAGLPTFKQLRFGNNNLVWINSSRYIPGIVCIDTKGTIKNNKDDKIRFSGPVFVNQDGLTEEISDIFFYDFDLDGTMWIGTNRGIFILKNPDDFINTDKPVFERIKISRNDGSGLADYLLNGVLTTAIYIDQGNRKWIGTLSNGVFLLSPDGTEELEHFTTENSPLPSDNILSITKNGLDGSVFFCTDKGIIEYGGTARDPENTLLDSSITVYPNPIMPDSEDMITVTGLTANSTIRFTGVTGNVLHIGRSNGGSYSWNLHDNRGNRLSSGIYYAIITDNENKKSVSISFTVIR